MAPSASTLPIASTRLFHVLLFVVGAYAWTWSFNALKTLAMRGVLDVGIPFPLLDIVAGLGPSLAALAVAHAESGGSGMRALLGRLLQWRAAWGWYVVAVLGPIALVLGAYGLWVATGGSPPPAEALASWPLVPVFFLYILFVGGGIDEELGWRGFALPRLQARYGALIASVMVGLFWAGWHIPVWFIPDSPQAALPFPVFLVSVTGTAVVVTGLYNSTGGSLPIVILAHTVFDLCTTGPWARALFTLPPSQRGLDPFLLITVAMVGAAVGLVLVSDPRTLTIRRRLRRRAAGG